MLFIPEKKKTTNEIQTSDEDQEYERRPEKKQNSKNKDNKAAKIQLVVESSGWTEKGRRSAKECEKK